MTWLWFHLAILKGGRRIEVSGGVGYHGPAERQRTKEEEQVNLYYYHRNKLIKPRPYDVE